MLNNSPQINPTTHFAGRTVLKIVKIGVLAFAGFNALIFLLLGSVFTLSAYGSITYTAESQGTVLAVQQNPSDDGTVYCTFRYSFEADGKPYTGKTTVGNPDACSFTTGSIVTVKYDPNKPTSNSADDTASAYVGIAMLGIGVILVIAMAVGLAINARAARREDVNNDGLLDDNMPATDAQLSVIQNGMRDLGEFWMPRKMTQNEAREIISTIDKKLSKRQRD